MTGRPPVPFAAPPQPPRLLDRLRHPCRVRHLSPRTEYTYAAGHGRVSMPTALAVKYPAAPTEWAWQYVFPASARCVDDRDGGRVKRHHLHESVIQKAVKVAVARPGSSSRRPSTPCGTPSPPTCWRTGTTSGRCRSCSGTRT